MTKAQIVKKTLELDPGDPMPTARLVAARHFTAERQLTLHHYMNSFYDWNGSSYQLTDPQVLRGTIYAFCETAFRRNRKGNLVPFSPNMQKVSNVVDALQAHTVVPRSMQLPTWLADAAERPPAFEMLSAANGLLHLPSREISPASPSFFTLNALDFAFDPDAAAASAWLAFLTSLWGDDGESIRALRQWFGYTLTPDTRQQKILLIVGPKRSGKGTIARVLTALLGQTNVCGPTLSSLGQNFGLEPLIGKQLAIIADARLGGRTDQQAIAERLLSISGEDGITIDRKFLPAWSGRIATRFMILTNELPRIADASGALASRFVVLTLQKSYLGKEDHRLTDRLLTELPGILNWAIDGWGDLHRAGRMVQPASAAQAIQEIEDLGSPISAFLRECCQIGLGRQVACTVLFERWRSWCREQGRDHSGTIQGFSRDLRAAMPEIAITQLPRSVGRARAYEGISVIDAEPQQGALV